MPEKSKTFTVRSLAFIGVMAAVVFAASSISISMPTPASDTTRLHLGNVMCLLSGLVLGPVPGGLAAGFGSLFFDLTNPLFIHSAPFTFIFKFLMAFVCGKISRRGSPAGDSFRYNVTGAICGALLYVILYLSKSYMQDVFFYRLEYQTALLTVLQKAVVSGTNGIIAVIAAIPLSAALRRGLQKANFSFAAIR